MVLGDESWRVAPPGSRQIPKKFKPGDKGWRALPGASSRPTIRLGEFPDFPRRRRRRSLWRIRGPRTALVVNPRMVRFLTPT